MSAPVLNGAFGPRVLAERYPAGSDFIVAVEAFWGAGGIQGTADTNVYVAACPSCRSKSHPDGTKRFPLVVRLRTDDGRWRHHPQLPLLRRAHLRGARASGIRRGAGDDGALRRLDVARMVREEPPAVPWVVEGLVVRGMLTVLNGREGEGKSLLTMALAAGVATGQDEAGLVCHLGGAVIVDAENGAYEIHRRVRTLDLPGDVEVREADGFDLRGNLGELEDVLAAHRPSLLVLDSFRSLWQGDQNDSREVAAALDPLRNLVRRHDVGTVLLHHSGKGNGAAYRGSSAIGASCELGFKLAREEDDDERERRYLECWKCRPAPSPGAAGSGWPSRAAGSTSTRPTPQTARSATSRSARSQSGRSSVQPCSRCSHPGLNRVPTSLERSAGSRRTGASAASSKRCSPRGSSTSAQGPGHPTDGSERTVAPARGPLRGRATPPPLPRFRSQSGKTGWQLQCHRYPAATPFRRASMRLEIELTDEQLDAIARRAAEVVSETLPGRDNGFLDVAGAADFLACPPSRIYSLVSANRIPHHRDGSRLLFDRDELRAYVGAGGAKRP